MRKKLLLPIAAFIALAMLVAMGACSTDELMPDAQPDANNPQGRTLSLTAAMPSEPTTRVGLTQEDDKSITLTWQADDVLQLAFVQGTTKAKTTAKVKTISTDKKQATFDIEIPNGFDTGVYDLYGVYGGGGLSDANPTQVQLPTEAGNATSLDGAEETSVQNRKDVILYFESTNIDAGNPQATAIFRHLGSLFSFTLQNNGDATIDDIKEVRLSSDEANNNWGYNTGAGNQVYDFVDGFQNKVDGSDYYIYFDATEKRIAVGEPLTFWAWYPPLPNVNWPALKIELIKKDNSTVASANALPARDNPTAAGKSYYFYAAWDGAELNFTNEAFTNELTINVPQMGTLGMLLSPTQKSIIKKLTVTGQINKADYDVMKLEMPSLTYVDLSQVTSYEGDILNKIPDSAFGSYDPTNEEDPFVDANQIIQTVILPQNATVIGANAFSGCMGITSALIIPENVATIGDRAFIGSSFNGSLTIPNKVLTIGTMAFSSSDFDRLIFQDGSSLTTIGTMAFTGCENLTGELNLPASLETIGNLAFTSNGFNKLTFQGGSKLTTISGSAFMACANLTGQLNLPESLVTIGNGAFYGCQFSGSLTIPSNVTTIGKTAFSGSKFTGPLIIPKEVITIGDYAFIECGFTGALALPANLQTIGDKAFQLCSGFNDKITFPSTLTSIGVFGFDGCANVTAFQFPHTTPIAYTTSMLPADKTLEVQVTAVDTYKATDLWKTHPIVPMFDEYAINVATKGTMSTLLTPLQKANIRKLTVTGQIDKADYDVMKSQMPNLRVVDLSQVTSYEGETENKIPDRAFEGNNTITTIFLPETVTVIGNYAFINCDQLSGELILPNGLEIIGNYAFYNCARFTGSLIIPDNVTTIGDGAFSSCLGFKGSLILPEGLKTIGFNAFNKCSISGTLILPKGLTTIGNYAFNECTNITGTVTFPSTLTSIGEYGFSQCYNIEVFQFPHTTPIAYTEDMLPAGTKVKVPAKAVEAYKAIADWHPRHPIVGYMPVEVEVPLSFPDIG